jgi:hypothetical protein
MVRCKVPEILSPKGLTDDAYLALRRRKPAPYLIRGRIRGTPQMSALHQPLKSDGGLQS